MKVREFAGFSGHGIGEVVKPIRVFGGSTHGPHRPDNVRPHAGRDLLVALYLLSAVSCLILEELSRSFHHHRIPARRATAVDPAIALGSGN